MIRSPQTDNPGKLDYGGFEEWRIPDRELYPRPVVLVMLWLPASIVEATDVFEQLWRDCGGGLGVGDNRPYGLHARCADS